ncbi:S8/S53 family peptidase, partial [bacterium]|nr:S8/S53 family peptidase [bacterium]
QIIDDRDLHVIISWFEPPVDPGTGNAMASFFFRYEPVEFASVDDAVTYFSGLPLVVSAWGNEIYAYDQDYTQGVPNDYYYAADQDCHINILGIDTNQYVDWGPPFGQWIATTTVAVVDDGVERGSKDFAIPGCPTNYKKISWCGITCDDKSARCGYGWGAPTEYDLNREGALVKHGTQVAGTITACTNSFGWGSAGVAPQIGVLPVRVRVTWDDDNEQRSSQGSFIQAIIALRKCFPNAAWVEDVRVANRSASQYIASGNPWAYAANKWIRRDITRCGRLWVASAGNSCAQEIRFPAALPEVLGVSGLWTVEEGDLWFPYLGKAGEPIAGSTWWPDAAQPPEDRHYQISAIMGFRRDDAPVRRALGWLPATPIEDELESHYCDFYGNSFATPQVAGLAALLFDTRPAATYDEVKNRIVYTRNQSIENEMLFQWGVPLAGLVDYEEALDGWN